jgi:RNA polymerase sigma-70 factor, ECF subfamily
MNLPTQAENTVTAIACNLKYLNDDLLVTAAKTGDVEAFVELRERHSTKILRTLWGITKNREDAEDALQETFFKAFRQLKKFESRCSFSSWVTRIAINSAIMVLRKKCTCKEMSIDSVGDGRDIGRLELRDLSEDPEHCYARREREELLRSAILRLPPAFRDVIELRQTGEYSVQELAECLGISMAAAKTRLLRAKVALRTLLT